MNDQTSPYQPLEHGSAANVVWHKQTVAPAQRAQLKQQKPLCIWLTGLSGSGKSTMANALEAKLHQAGHHTMLLDGDNVRHNLCRDLSMSDEDRTENIRRVADVAKLMTDAGLIVITAFISPFKQDRQLARNLFNKGQFIEVFIDTSLETCQERDPKGLYKKAISGEISDFTGISSPYEKPENAEIIIDCNDSPEQPIEHLFETIKKIIID